VLAATDSSAPPPVLVYGDPRLRRRCREVTPDEDLGPLVDAMRGAMAAHDGVGLAAPQIGDLRRVVLIGDPQRPEAPPQVLVNPRIRQRFGTPSPFEEGCLSFPGLFLWLDRPPGVEATWRDPTGEQHAIRDTGLLARVLQHEVDHLDGILFVDHLPRWRRWLLHSRLWRLRQRARRKESA
jgi:peptide deformylase